MCTPRRHIRYLPVIGFILAASLIQGVQAGDYYKWVDKQGVTHFSEKPVPGSAAQKVGTATKYSDTPADDSANQDQPAAAALEKPEEASQNAENCKIAQDRMKSLRSGQRIRMVAADGKFTYLDENQVKDEITKTQDVIKNSCR